MVSFVRFCRAKRSHVTPRQTMLQFVAQFVYCNIDDSDALIVTEVYQQKARFNSLNIQMKQTFTLVKLAAGVLTRNTVGLVSSHKTVRHCMHDQRSIM